MPFKISIKKNIRADYSIFLGICCLLLAFILGFIRLHFYPFIVKPEIKIVADTRLSKFIALDHEGFLADMLFIQVNLHSGSLMWKPLYINFDSKWAYDMMDVITELDPKFFTAYLFSAMGLVHAFDDVRLAEPILKKGMKEFPDSWELPFWTGYGHYNHLMEYQKASEYLWEAYNKPEAPKHFLAIMLSAMQKAGSFDRAAIAMKALMDRTDKQNLKIIYAKKIQRLLNLDLIMQCADKYKAERGRFPETIEELILNGYLKQIPKDPFGSKYGWNSDKKLPHIL